MLLVESKVLQTQFESEIYMDEESNIILSNIELPEDGFSDYKLNAGVKLTRIRDNEYYGTETSYFGLSISYDLDRISIFNPEEQSIFSIKNEEEIAAALELVRYILIESPAFKQKVESEIEELRKTNVVSAKDIFEVKEKLTVLEKLGKIQQGSLNTEL
ncbi:hypothetical protein [Peribacillus kribbensis]|uniref:hypothetical protein n=1 Tax=Peribacillus kribbensis TaxID=356658 RepID=UPI00041EACDB|nr:hypothetical protein [Peribacillus kribbensis]